MPTSASIIASYSLSYSGDPDEEVDSGTLRDRFTEYEKHNPLEAKDVSTPLAYYRDLLKGTDKILFPFMDEESRHRVLRDLQCTYWLLLVQRRYEEQRHKTEHFAGYDEDLERCAELIDALNDEEYYQDKPIQPSLAQNSESQGCPVRYLGICLGQELAKAVAGFMNNQTKSIRKAMGALNEKRLYWVWGGSLLKTALALMPDDFLYVGDARRMARVPDPYTGTLSWLLYYARFFLNLSLLMKHTIAGPWMSKEEQMIPWTERFQTQWAFRKFTLLNDSLWGLCNMATFFWLTGKGLAGSLGDMLTIILLVFDISVAVWDFAEQQANFEQEKEKYKKDIAEIDKDILKEEERLKKAREAADLDLDEKEKVIKQLEQVLREYRMQRRALDRAQKRCQKDWDYTKLTLINNVTYAVGLMLAYVLLAAPFFPVAGAALMAITVTGAVLCFAFTVISNGVKGGIELHKAMDTAEELKEELNGKLDAFWELLKEPGANREDPVNKLLFLEIKQWTAKTEHQEQKILLQKLHLVRSVFFEALVPAIVFVNLVFLPMGVGFGVLGAVLALAFLSHYLIEKYYNEEAMKVPEFKEEEYNLFCDRLQKDDAAPSQSAKFQFKFAFIRPKAGENRTEILEKDDENALDAHGPA